MTRPGYKVPSLHGLHRTFTIALPTEPDTWETRKCIRLMWEEAADKGLTTPAMLALILRKRYKLPAIDIKAWKWERFNTKSVRMAEILQKHGKDFGTRRAMKYEERDNVIRVAKGKLPKGILFLKGAKEYDPSPAPKKGIKTPLT